MLILKNFGPQKFWLYSSHVARLIYCMYRVITARSGISAIVIDLTVDITKRCITINLSCTYFSWILYIYKCIRKHTLQLATYFNISNIIKRKLVSTRILQIYNQTSFSIGNLGESIYGHLPKFSCTSFSQQGIQLNYTIEIIDKQM